MSQNDDGPGAGLAWPDHDRGPTPPPGHEARRRDEQGTRRPVPLWDRVKIMLLLVGSWSLIVLTIQAEHEIMPFQDALRDGLRSYGWILLLAAFEAVRQMHYLVCEESAAYNRFWTDTVFGAMERRVGRLNDWTRFRVARAAKWLFALAVVAIVMGRVTGEHPVAALVQLPATIWSILPLILQLLFAFFFIIFQFIGLFWFLSRGGTETYFPDDIKTRFDDVWGQDSVLSKVKENLLFLDDPESIEQKGGYVPGGILLWGPPGTGKTLMAEAVAGETGKPFIFVEPAAFQNMFMGVGVLKVKALFRKARKLALRYGGVVMFFDEADSLGNRGQLAPGGWAPPRMAAATASPLRSCNGLSYLSPDTASLVFRSALTTGGAEEPLGWRQRFVVGAGMGGGGMGTLQALLAEISGLKKPRGFFNRIVRRALGMRPKPPPKYRILIILATNLPEALDEALLRPGRIDRIYKVGYPSKEGRMRTYRGYLDKVPHDLTDEDVDKLATITPYATGASIKDLVNEALINAIRNGRERIVWEDVIAAKHLKDLGPPEDVEYIERERHAVAVHEACHAVVAYRVRQHLTIDIATIQKGGTYLGMVASIPPEDQFTRWKSEYEADVMVSLASLAGERMFFSSDSSSGVSGDLISATQISSFMEAFWGMGTTVTSHAVVHELGIGGGRKPRPGDDPRKKPKDLLEGSLGDRIEQRLHELLERTEKLLADNRREVLAVAHALETHKTLAGEDVRAIIEGVPGPLVDGRPYADPAFLAAAEAYHERVLSAHQGHAKVDVPLPTFVVGAGELAATSD